MSRASRHFPSPNERKTMSLVSLDEFKDVLDVGEIYTDEQLQPSIDAAEEIVLGLLSFHSAAIVATKLQDNVATYTTRALHRYSVGDSITITGCASTYNGTKTIATIPNGWTFTINITHADITGRELIPVGKTILAGTATMYDTNPDARAAALMIAVDIFNARQAASGQLNGIDMNLGSYRMGRSLAARVLGLIQHLRSPESKIR